MSNDNLLNNLWISVEEKTPETYDWVLVAPMLVPEGWYGVPAICEYRNGVWFDRVQEGPFEEWTGTKITHWMPLPDEPGRGQMNAIISMSYKESRLEHFKSVREAK